MEIMRLKRKVILNLYGMILIMSIVGCAGAEIRVRKNPKYSFGKIKKVIVVSRVDPEVERSPNVEITHVKRIGQEAFLDQVTGELLKIGLEVIEYHRVYDLLSQYKAYKETAEAAQLSDVIESPYGEVKNFYLSLLSKYYGYLGIDAVIEAAFLQFGDYTAKVIDVHSGTIVATVQAKQSTGLSKGEEAQDVAEAIAGLFKKK